jgi:hypothetical protein
MAPSDTARAAPADAGSDPRKASCLAADDFQIARTNRPLQGPRYEPRFQHQIERIHALGPVVLAYILEALAAGGELRATVAEFAALPGEVICEFGGDKFPVALHVIDGERP